MDRLMYVIAFTHDLDRLKTFYRDVMGLEITTDTPGFVSFGTGGASLALLAVRPQQEREFEMCFYSGDLEADMRRLRATGVEFLGEPREIPGGRVVHARDPEGNLLSLMKPKAAPAPGRGIALTTVVLNCKDVTAAKVWYRDRLGLVVNIDSPWWVEFDGGETHVALHPMVDQGVLETHHAEPVSIGFASGDLEEWIQELEVRGAAIAQKVTDRGFGRFAEIEDPDGNTLVLRDSPTPPTLEEKLAEDFESEDEPHHESIRRIGNKNAKATSRVAVRPDYHTKKPPASRPLPHPVSAIAAEKMRRAPSVRGAGLDHARLKPVKSRDPERVHLRPASGHQKKATTRSLERQKIAAAATSRAKPVKRVAKKAAPKRAVARTTSKTASKSRPATKSRTASRKKATKRGSKR
jgi:predicted enzyme related to lactoylglutathione lyase